MQAVVSTWLNLEKTIFKPENKTIYGTNDHLWRLKFYVISWSTVFKNWKNYRWERRQEAVNKEKGGKR